MWRYRAIISCPTHVELMSVVQLDGNVTALNAHQPSHNDVMEKKGQAYKPKAAYYNPTTWKATDDRWRDEVVELQTSVPTSDAELGKL